MRGWWRKGREKVEHEMKKEEEKKKKRMGRKKKKKNRWRKIRGRRKGGMSEVLRKAGSSEFLLQL